MAHDFGASYDEMDRMSKKLTAAGADIHSQLVDLQKDVQTLLGNDFKTQHASEKFGQGYDDLTNGLTKAVEGIGDMGDELTKMKHAIEQLDGGMG